MTHALRAEVLATARRLNELGLAQGTSGNVSARVPGGLLITPSGIPFGELDPAAIVRLRLDGTVVGGGRPSSEWRLHTDLYRRREDAQAIVHTHSLYATSLACLRQSLPAVHYMIAVAGGNDVRCAEYATFGSPELAAHAVRALEGRRACLLANHGLVALGDSLAGALHVAREIELVAAQYWHARQLGEPVILDDAEMAAVHERFRGYGKP